MGTANHGENNGSIDLSMTPAAIAIREERARKKVERIKAAVEAGTMDDPSIPCLDPEIEAMHRQKTQRKIDAINERYKKPIKSLKRVGSVAVALKSGADPSEVTRGFALNPRITGEVLWLPADGYVQGEHNAEVDPDIFSQQIKDIRKESGFGILGFTGVNYGPNPGRGTDGIFSRVINLIYSQESISPFNRPTIGIVGVGEASEEQLIALNNGARVSDELYFPDFLISRYVLKKDGSFAIANVGAIDLPDRPLAEGEIVPREGLPHITRPPIDPGFDNPRLP